MKNTSKKQRQRRKGEREREEDILQDVQFPALCNVSAIRKEREDGKYLVDSSFVMLLIAVAVSYRIKKTITQMKKEKKK